MTLEERYLLAGLRTGKPLVTCEDILNDPSKLERVGTMVKEYREELDLIIQARISPIREDLLLHCSPYETVQLRNIIIELAMLGDDFNKYVNGLELLMIENAKKAEEEKAKEDGKAPDIETTSM